MYGIVSLIVGFVGFGITSILILIGIWQCANCYINDKSMTVPESLLKLGKKYKAIGFFFESDVGWFGFATVISLLFLTTFICILGWPIVFVCLIVWVLLRSTRGLKRIGKNVLKLRDVAHKYPDTVEHIKITGFSKL